MALSLAPHPQPRPRTAHHSPCHPPPPPPTPFHPPPPAVWRLTHPRGNMPGFLAAWAQRGTLSFNRWKKFSGSEAPRLHRPKCQGVGGWVGVGVVAAVEGGDQRKSHNTCSICRHGWLHILPRPRRLHHRTAVLCLSVTCLLHRRAAKKKKGKKTKKNRIPDLKKNATAALLFLQLPAPPACSALLGDYTKYPIKPMLLFCFFF